MGGASCRPPLLRTARRPRFGAHLPLLLLLLSALLGAAGAQNATSPAPPPAAKPPPPSFDVELDAAWVFLDLAVIMLVCRFVGIAFKSFGQPAVIGEIIAGILLGPSGLGQQYPCPTGSTAVTTLYPHGAPCDARNPTLVLFPTFTPFQGGPNNIRNYLGVCAQIGVVLFMFVVGLEVDLHKMRQTSAKAAIIAACSVATPFLVGTFKLGPYLYDKHGNNAGSNGTQVSSLAFNLVVGTCLSVTAFPVLARIITEQKLQKLRLGSATLACAALNDVVAWSLLAVVLAVQKSSSNGGEVAFAPVLIELAWLVFIIIVQFMVVGPLMRLTVFNHYMRTGNLSNNRLAWTLIGMFLSAWLLHHIGFHSMIGSFTFGLVFPRGRGTPFLYNILNKIEPFTTLVLLPLFFMTTGLSVNLSMLNQAGLDLLWVLIVASGGKFFGSAISAKLVGFNNRHSVALGVMMNTRGLTEIVLLNVAKQAGIINDLMFATLVMMAVITTAMAGPLLSLLFPTKQLILERKADMAFEAAAHPSKHTNRLDNSAASLVVIVHDLDTTARLLEASVSTLAPGMKAHLDVANYILPGELHTHTELGTGLFRSPEELAAKQAIKDTLAAVHRRGLTSSVTVLTTENPVADAAVHIQAADPHLVVTDWPASQDERNRLHDLVVNSTHNFVLWGGNTGAAPAGVADKHAELHANGNGTIKEDVEVGPTATAPRHGRSDSDVPQLLRSRESEQDLAALGTAHAKHSRAGDGATASELWHPSQPLPSLRKLLTDSHTQDVFVEGCMVLLWDRWARLQQRALQALPSALRPAPPMSASDAADLNDDDGDAEANEAANQHTVMKDGSVVTPQTMAVAAAASLSPKFTKVIVTGWPVGEVECAEIIRWLQSLENTAMLAGGPANRLTMSGGRDSLERQDMRPSSFRHSSSQRPSVDEPRVLIEPSNMKDGHTGVLDRTLSVRIVSGNDSAV